MSATASVILSADRPYDQIRSAVQSGSLERLRRGAYITPARRHEGQWERAAAVLNARCIAIQAALTCTFTFSHTTAAALHGWPVPIGGPAHISQPVVPSSDQPKDIIRHCHALAEDEVVSLPNGAAVTLARTGMAGGELLQVTSPERTILDCALLCTAPLGLAIADAGLRALAGVSRFQREESIRRQDLVRADLLSRLDERGPVRHIRRARAVIAAADGLAESPGESWSRWLGLSHGFAKPALQLPVLTAEGLRYPDLVWRFSEPGSARWVLGEYDGEGKYDVAGSLVEEKHREDLLADALGDVRIVRFNRLDRRQPELAFARLLGAAPDGTELRLLPRRDLVMA